MVFLPPPGDSVGADEDEFSDARAPDNDALWRQPEADSGTSPEARKATLISRCEEKLQRALGGDGPRSLISAIRTNGCVSAAPFNPRVRVHAN